MDFNEMIVIVFRDMAGKTILYFLRKLLENLLFVSKKVSIKIVVFLDTYCWIFTEIGGFGDFF